MNFTQNQHLKKKNSQEFFTNHKPNLAPVFLLVCTKFTRKKNFQKLLNESHKHKKVT